ncbi:MAG TPA: ATP-dependent DNA helicase RecG [Terriglobales bacterium]|nr:ATP-dependent DNA helicase RecG [Terriglobales bacterium]
MLELDSQVQYVKGVGPARAVALAAKGITTVEDLLYYLPFRYEDRSNPRRIADLRPGEMATLVAEVRTSALFRTRRMPIFEMTVGELGDHRPPEFGKSPPATIKCMWFNATYLKDRFKPGQVLALYGKVEEDKRHPGRLQLMQPQIEVLSEDPEENEEALPESLEIGRIVPIYEGMGKGMLTSRGLRRVIRSALESVNPELPETIPEPVRKRMGLIPRMQAFWRAHWPEPDEPLRNLQASRSAAHIRLIFEELFFLQLGLELKRRSLRERPGISFRLDESIREALKRILPFKPTAAQKKVLGEIAADMRQAIPMRRLLQGDVGSGKTIVAFQAAIIAIENGYQVALMAPTEILATQHYFSARSILEKAGYRIVLLTGSLEQDRKRDIRRHLAQGNAQLVIGTHALIEEKVEFARPGLIIVDEQHRFGVMQRLKIMKKSRDDAENTPEPDVLVMTATPIPRTLALTIYGELDVSIIDELPPGRTPTITRRVADTRSDEVFDFVRKQVAAGHQAYVVYPVIEEGAMEGELKAAIQMYDELRKHILPDLRIGLLHGRMEADEKDSVMRRFQRRELDILVSTTVIEVGVDVPNATVMVIEHAERFGLSQLHQLRGRIGRGAAKSYCILMTGSKISEEGEQRLATMVRTQDGFEIAETDLQLRGPGEFFGTRQSGIPSFRVANLVRDRELMEAARREAAFVLSGSAEVPQSEVSRALVHLRASWQRRYGLVEVG